MTIASKLQLTLDTKAAIKQALINKGATPNDVFSTYPSIIESLATAGIATPQIIAPMNGAVQVSQQPIITATLYFSADPDDIHVASTWEFASDSAFTNILHTSGRDTQNLEIYDFSSEGAAFTQNGVVFARVTYETQSGVESTSPVVSFEVLIIEIGSIINGDLVYAQLGGDWLLVTPSKLWATRLWGLYGTDTTLPNNQTPDPNTGTYNTSVLTSSTYSGINDGYATGAPAAEYCRAIGCELPNREELGLMYDSKDLIDSADISGEGITLESVSNYLWSSTEYSGNESYARSFSTGSGIGRRKYFPHGVVPIKRIPI